MPTPTPAEEQHEGLYIDGEPVKLRLLTIREMEFVEQYTGRSVSDIDFDSVTGRKALVLVMRRRKGQVAETALDDLTFEEFNKIFEDPPAAREVPTRGAKGAKNGATAPTAGAAPPSP